MALSNGLSAVDTDAVIRRSGSEPQPESKEDLEQLESDLPKMAQKILEYRAALPDELKATLATGLSVHRPILPGMDPGPSKERNPDSRPVESNSENSIISMADGEKRTTEKIVSVEDKVSAKRLRECIFRMEKLDSCNGIMHPAFRKRKDQLR
ncbi:hypothetical protein SLEP1_g2457 [Rubroshorea leprosula]|uniref:Uncharacterized protein n=1 Tax=Rubroshorea leprosula TaxID=152421 RepID=A0AAV5HQK3_9ROSI|nr:hypothetical protein SLEP1_g2457 [Rubroshorea leprosula]